MNEERAFSESLGGTTALQFGSRCAAAPAPDSRAHGEYAWHPPPRALAPVPCCSFGDHPGDKPRARATSLSHRAGPSWLVGHGGWLGWWGGRGHNLGWHLLVGDGGGQNPSLPP